MIKKCTEIHHAFLDKFNYFPKVPWEVIVEERRASEEFYEVVKHSIETGIDKTIEKYGTDPTYGTMPFRRIRMD